MTVTPDFLTVEQVAERWRCSPDTVRRRIRQRQLPAFTGGGPTVVKRADLERYERTRTTSARHLRVTA